MKIIGLIPARMESTRLNGKAIKLIEGLPMIAHVYFRSKLSKELDEVYVCTDSQQIENICSKYAIPIIKTGSHHVNGTERCGEAANILGLKNNDIIIDIQGDEPLINPTHIDAVCNAAKNSNADIILPHLEVKTSSVNIVKVVSKEKTSEVLYLSRADIPYNFRGDSMLKKHLSIISFLKISLDKYCDENSTALEKLEGIELLRALELNLKIKTIRLDGENRAVDVMEDLIYVRKYMQFDPWFREYKKYIY